MIGNLVMMGLPKYKHNDITVVLNAAPWHEHESLRSIVVPPFSQWWVAVYNIPGESSYSYATFSFGFAQIQTQ